MVTTTSDGGNHILPEVHLAYPWLRGKLWYWSLRSGIEFSDLLSLALVKIAEADRTYDRDRNVSLKTWQCHNVDWAIKLEMKQAAYRVNMINQYGAELEYLNTVSDNVYLKDIMQRKKLVKQFDKFPKDVQERVLLWVIGNGPKEIGEVVGRTLETVNYSLTRYLPYYKDVQNEECRNGHLYGQYNFVRSRGPKVCLACDQYADKKAYERKKEMV